MIGQKKLLSVISEQIDKGKYPRFSILVGPEGSGKKTLTLEISKSLGANHVFVGSGVDAVRQVINDAYKISMPIVYVFADADTMSPAAKNALLKITEEPPKNAYFILTLLDINNTLYTIRSRGAVYFMDPYMSKDIDKYYISKYEPNEEDRRIITELCETPGEVDQVIKMGAVNFYNFVEKVVDSVADVQVANALKIGQYLKLKETDTNKHDLRLFFKAFMFICSSRLREDPFTYAIGIQIASRYIQELRINGINKQGLLDMFIFDIREAWQR